MSRRPYAQPQSGQSAAVVELQMQIRALRLPPPEYEVRFHPVRKWRADVLWRAPRRLIVELEGGVFIGGRHTRGVSFEADCEKYAEAMVLGFLVLRVTPRQVRTGAAIGWIQHLLQV